MLQDLNYLNIHCEKENSTFLKVENDPYKAMECSHDIAIVT